MSEVYKRAERLRLRRQAFGEDVLRATHTIEVKNFVKDFSKLKDTPLTFRMNVIFDEAATNRPHSPAYLSAVSGSLRKLGCEIIQREPAEDIIDVEIVRRGLTKTDSELLQNIITIGMNGNHFHFSELVYPRIEDDKGETLLFHPPSGDVSNYGVGLKFPTKLLGVPKVAYEGKTSFRDVESYNGREKDSIIELALFCLGFIEHPTAGYIGLEPRRLLFLECLDRQLAYDPLAPIGRKPHQSWRIETEDKEWIKVDIDSLPKFEAALYEIMTNKEKSGIGFYPHKKQRVKYKGNELTLTTRLIRENDPSKTLGMPHAAKVSDVLFYDVIKPVEENAIYKFSGSESARVESNIDAISLLDNLDYLYGNFPFTAYATSESLTPEEQDSLINRYETVIRAYSKATYLDLIEKLLEHNIAPRVTTNSRSEFIGLCTLFDVPPTVSIGIGSPKKIGRFDSRTTTILEKINPEYRQWSYNYNFFLYISRPIEYCPKDWREALEISNTITALNYLNDYSSEIEYSLKQKISVDVFKKRFESTDWKNFEYVLTKPNKFERELLQISPP